MSFFIFDVQEVNDRRQTIKLSMYFVVKWLEPRLNINEDAAEWDDEDVAANGYADADVALNDDDGCLKLIVPEGDGGWRIRGLVPDIGHHPHGLA